MSKPFKLPPIRTIARNALKAYRDGKLQGSVRLGDGGGCYYNQAGTVCVIGASLPKRVAKKADALTFITNSSVKAVMASNIFKANSSKHAGRIINLQRQHDALVRTGNETTLLFFMKTLKELAR